jgi:hypothetical protein
MDSQKVKIWPFQSFRRKPEIQEIQLLLDQAFAGVTTWETFCEAITSKGRLNT